MLLARDFRNQAWNALNGKWGTMAICELIFSLIVGAAAGATFFAGGVASLLVAGPLSLGMAILTLYVIRGFQIKVETLFDGFRNFLNAFLLALLTGIFIVLWSLLLIIPGIIKAYSYSMSTFILADNPNLSPNDAIKFSMAMMNGNKWRLFCLDFSFIGWYILCILTLGILTFWIVPYHLTARAAFYQSLLAEQNRTLEYQPA